MSETTQVLQTYFGKWGGFFVPDPMTPALDEMTSAVSSLLEVGELRKNLKEVIETNKSKTKELKTTRYENIFTGESLAGWYVMAGYGSLAKATKREIVAGAATPEEARLILAICHRLELPFSIWLNVTTGSDVRLVEELENAGATVNLNQCRELFDDPDMYAFQKFIANPARYLWAPVHTHSGPAPFPALTAYFSEVAAEDLMTDVLSKFSARKITFLAPAFPGITLAGLINANRKQLVKLTSYEPKADSQREECYLGAYTQVTQIGKKDFILSPELLYAWETGSVERIETTAPIETIAKKKSSDIFVVIEE